MKKTYLFLITNDIEQTKLVIAIAEIYGQTYKDKETFQAALNHHNLVALHLSELENFIDGVNFKNIEIGDYKILVVYIIEEPKTFTEKRHFNRENESEYYYSPFSVARRELRTKWNNINPVPAWEEFLYHSEIEYQQTKKQNGTNV